VWANAEAYIDAIIITAVKRITVPAPGNLIGIKSKFEDLKRLPGGDHYKSFLICNLFRGVKS
jgi:hypothetical protein